MEALRFIWLDLLLTWIPFCPDASLATLLLKLLLLPLTFLDLLCSSLLVLLVLADDEEEAAVVEEIVFDDVTEVLEKMDYVFSQQSA